MEYRVPMARLPKGLRFPRDLADRVRFDAEAGQLCYSGFMVKADFDRLLALSDDWAYRRPLEDLFRLTSTPEHRLSSRFRRLFGRAGAAGG